MTTIALWQPLMNFKNIRG